MQVKQTDTVIIGAGITGLTLGFHLIRKGRKVHLLERENRTGGQIRTFQQDGFVFESGPNTGVVSYPEVAELFSMLAPTCRLETAREESERRLIWKKDRFHNLPGGLWSGLTTPLFTWHDKFRILGEPFRKKGTNPDESVGELTCRRLGHSFLKYAIDPFISGIYAGDPMRLVTRYALPKLYNLEQQYGSFIKGGLAKARQPKTDRDRLASKKVFSAAGGLESLTDALTEKIGNEHITLSASGIRVEKAETGWLLRYFVEGEPCCLRAEKVITTTGAYSLPELLPFIPETLMNRISNLLYAPIIQVAVGIKDTGPVKLNAFGGLIPSVERQEVLGILFPSACFENRAPGKGAVCSFFIGGVKRSDIMKQTDEEIIRLVLKGFHSILGFPEYTSPDMIRIFRHSRAIPQYDNSCGERLKAIREVEKTWPGLVLGGNIRDGIGLADRMRQAATLSI